MDGSARGRRALKGRRDPALMLQEPLIRREGGAGTITSMRPEAERPAPSSLVQLHEQASKAAKLRKICRMVFVIMMNAEKPK